MPINIFGDEETSEAVETMISENPDSLNLFGDPEVIEEVAKDGLSYGDSEDLSYGTSEEPEDEFSRRTTPDPLNLNAGQSRTQQLFKSFADVASDIGRVYPVAEAAANITSSTWGLPLSGLAGLIATEISSVANLDIDKGLKFGDKVRRNAEDFLVYQPKTERGQKFTESLVSPMAAYNDIAGSIAQRIDDAGNPATAAVVKTGIQFLPTLISGRAMLRQVKASLPSEISAEYSRTISKGLKKGVNINPKAKQYSSIVKFDEQGELAITKIIENKNRLGLTDKYNEVVEGLPNDLPQFAQAIENTKGLIYEDIATLLKQTEEGSASTRPTKFLLKDPMAPNERIVPGGVTRPTAIGTKFEVDLNKTAAKLDELMDNDAIRRFAPETIKYAAERKEFLLDRGGKQGATDAHNSIKILNQTLDHYYRDPTPALKGKALVDAFIADDMRTQLDTIVNSATDTRLAPLQEAYGALKVIEPHVNKKVLQEARKSGRGILDLANISSVGHVVKGLMSHEPATVAAGVATKAMVSGYKLLVDPNRQVKRMFKNADDLLDKHGVGFQRPLSKKSPVSEDIQKRYESGNLTPDQVKAFMELRKRGKL